MSDAAVSRTAARPRVGPTLRAVLLTPEAGFAAAARAAQRREQAGRRPTEGFAPGVVAVLGFGALGLLWLRLASLLNLREVAAADFRWDFLVASFVLTGLIGLGLQQLWGLLGPTAIRILSPGSVKPSRPVLRSVWGLALFPQVLGLAFLLPLDLLIVGPESFTSERLVDPLAKLWAALSITAGTALAAWSLWLFYKGLTVVIEHRGPRAIGVTAAAVSLSIATVLLLALISRGLGGAA
ncbi:MAG TPA: hypothetical protein VHJ82_04035 [Actinomycetota bacterium]|nr:hypothetical protein [Actinomycetota bacterium]